MKVQTAQRLVRFMHRLSGLLLIPLMLIKLLSGYGLVNKVTLFDYSAASKMHLSRWLDIPLLLFVIFHASFGVLRVLLPKIKNKIAIQEKK